MGGENPLWKSMRSNAEKYNADTITISNMALAGVRKNTFFLFPPGRIGLLAPWPAVTLKYHVPTHSLFT